MPSGKILPGGFFVPGGGVNPAWLPHGPDALSGLPYPEGKRWKPKLEGGTRDLLPQECAERAKSYRLPIAPFVPLRGQTPAFGF
jgi:hypothetical protein